MQAIIDRGPGMTPEFIRDELFRPLSTSKAQGSGIGAWQKRFHDLAATHAAAPIAHRLPSQPSFMAKM